MNHGALISFRPPGSSRARRAFTLIELLVVIAIIAVLVALLFPVFSGMIRKGQQSTSANNLRQWYAGYAASVGENDGEMPTSGYVGSKFDGADPAAWFNRIPAATKETRFRDFSTTPQLVPRPGQKSIWINPAVPSSMAVPGEFLFCYGYNSRLVAPAPAADADPLPLRQAALQFPHMTILMGEKADPLPHLNISNTRAYFGPGGDPLVELDNEANFLFCDGHVEAVKRRVFQDASLTDAEDPIRRKQTNITWKPNLPE